MKLLTLTALLTFIGIGLSLGLCSDPGSATNIPIDCNECREHRDLCLKYGNGDRNSGEPKVCTSYICRKWEVGTSSR